MRRLHKKVKPRETETGTFPAVQCLRLSTYNAGGCGSDLWQKELRSRMPFHMSSSQKLKRENCFFFFFFLSRVFNSTF